MEELKFLNEITVPDIRSCCHVLVNEQTGEQIPIDLRLHHETVQAYQLKPDVPEDIGNHFATSLNLLLYSWYVFRFQEVAKFQALTTLEFALRERIGPVGLKEIKAQKKKMGLHSYIAYAIEKGWIVNQDFSAYHRAPRLKAEHERSIEIIQKMEELGLNEYIDDEELVVPEENDFNFLEVLQEWPNKARNEIAHGSNWMTGDVWLVFEYCTEFINKLFANSNVKIGSD